MRNTPLPLVLVLLTVAGVLLWLHFSPIAEPGAEGPRFEPGIFRLPKDERKLVKSAELEFKEQWPDIEDGTKDMCPLENWRVIVLQSSGMHPIESSVALAMAEELTRRGSIVILSTSESPPFPMPADMFIHLSIINTTDIGLPGPPKNTTESYEFTMEVDWQPASKVMGENHGESRFRNMPLAITSKPEKVSLNPDKPFGWHPLKLKVQARTGTIPKWPEWYAAVGRHISNYLISRGTGGVRLPLLDPKTGRWSASLLPKADWGTSLHLPPQCDGLRWYCSYQEEFVRGWVGGIKDPEAKNFSDTPGLERRLASGKWQKTNIERQWSRQQDGITTYLQLELIKSGNSIFCWQDRPDGTAIIQRWLHDLDSPDAAAASIARRQLSRYCHVNFISDDLRKQIFAKLGLKAPAE